MNIKRLNRKELAHVRGGLYLLLKGGKKVTLFGPGNSAPIGGVPRANIFDAEGLDGKAFSGRPGDAINGWV